MWAENADKTRELKTKLHLVFMKLESQIEIVPTEPIRLNCLGCYHLVFNGKMELQTLKQ